jgi:hypothetical protein
VAPAFRKDVLQAKQVPAWANPQAADKGASAADGRASAREQSLSCHLALVACRDGYGNGHLVNELMRAVYLSWYLQRAGYSGQPVARFKIAECAVETTLSHAHATGEWRLAYEAVSDFEALLTLYDAQLASVPLHEVLEAERRLRAFLAGTDNSPIPLPT